MQYMKYVKCIKICMSKNKNFNVKKKLRTVIKLIKPASHLYDFLVCNKVRKIQNRELILKLIQFSSF